MINRNLRRGRSVAVLACLAGAFPVVAMSTTATATAAGGSGRMVCKTPRFPGNGKSLSLTTFHLGCAAGQKVSLDQYKCRTRKGKLGVCKRVDGYKCDEQRLYNKGFYDGRVACTRGNVAAVYIYRQKR